MKKPLGIYVEHRTRKTNWLYAVPVFTQPWKDSLGVLTPRMCNLCKVPHFCKTIHLDLVQGRAIVSRGVLDSLRKAGLPNLGIVGTTKTPPPLVMGGKATTRVAQNQTNRKLTIWKRKGVLANAST